jgi:hypothetical protein
LHLESSRLPLKIYLELKMKMNKSIIAISLMSALVATSALAAPSESAFTNNNVVVGYTSMDVDGFEDNLTGFSVDAVHRLAGRNFYGLVSYSSVDTEMMGVSVEMTNKEFGMGYIYSVNSKFDINFEAAIINSESESGGYTMDEGGYRVGAIGRYMVMPKVEIFAGVDMVQYKEDSIDSDTGLTVGVRYSITDKFDAVFEVTSADDQTGMMIGASYRW